MATEDAAGCGTSSHRRARLAHGTEPARKDKVGRLTSYKLQGCTNTHRILYHRAEAHQKTESLEALLERQRQRAAILLAENEDLRTRVADSEAAEAAVRDEMTELEAKSARTGNSFQAMRLFLDQYRSQMESNVLQMQQRMLEASQRLHDMEARVQSAAQRVQLGAAIVAQNNVKRRNAAAVASVRSVSLASSSSSSSTADDALVTGLRDLAPEVCAPIVFAFAHRTHDENLVAIYMSMLGRGSAPVSLLSDGSR